jgi:hypothetical protein
MPCLVPLGVRVPRAGNHCHSGQLSCPCARHEGVWESGGIAPVVLNFGTR